MKRLLSMMLFTALCMTSLASCNGVAEVEPEAEQTAMHDIVITVDEIKEGQAVSGTSVTVQLDGESLECEPTWIIYSEDDYDYLAQDDTFPANYWGRLDVYYYLPNKMEVDNINVEIQAPGGTYDGTGDVGINEAGQVHAWSHIQYGSDPIQADTEKLESNSEAPETNSSATSEHTHNWAHDSIHSAAAGCTYDGYSLMRCTICGNTYQEPVYAKGHAYTETIAKAATCTDSGIRRFSCANCGTVYEDIIYPTGHNWSGWGDWHGIYHTRTCNTCGAYEEYQHTFEHGFCTTCGKELIVN